MLKFLLVLLTIFILQTSPQNIKGTFSFSWLGGHCYLQELKYDNYEINDNDLCGDSKLARWDQSRSFTMHGLWPDLNRDSERLSIKFDLSALSSIKDDLNNYWPKQFRERSKYPNGLWQHEWDEHGVVYAYVVNKLFPKKYSNTQLVTKFYKDALDFYKRFPKLQKLTKGSYTKLQLSALVGLPVDQFQVNCARLNSVKNSQYLREIRVCYESSKSGDQVVNTPIACTSTGTTCKSGTLILNDWKNTSQTRVTA